MGKYTRDDIQRLAQDMRNAASDGHPFAVLTGAGISKSAGIPLVGELVTLFNQKFGHHLSSLNETSRPFVIPDKRSADPVSMPLAAKRSKSAQIIPMVLCTNFVGCSCAA